MKLYYKDYELPSFQINESGYLLPWDEKLNNYVLNNDSDGVSVTLKKEYTDTLDRGTHEIKISALYGESTSNFTIENKLINPETGNKLILFSIFIITILGLGTYVYKKKRI